MAFLSGADGGTRTRDLFLTKEVLYLLSYISVSMISTVYGDLRLPAFLPPDGFTKEVLYLLSYISVSIILTVCGGLSLPAFLPPAGFTGVRVLCEGVTPSRSHAFYYKNAPKVTGEAVTFGAILYKSKGCGDDIPAGVQGRRPCQGQRAKPLGHSRAFSDMCGENAPAMTQRGERVSAERKE